MDRRRRLSHTSLLISLAAVTASEGNTTFELIEIHRMQIKCQL
jgi:hypothetical protein